MKEARKEAEAHDAAEQLRRRPQARPIRLGELLQRMSPSDLVRIKVADEVIFSGFRMQAPHIYDDEVVGRFGPTMDVFRNDWEEKGLRPPLDPGELPKYEFKNLNIRLYMVFELDV